ncbi:MAG TPA: class I SAM-dependent methyltransferase [Actinomycetes bacterium]|nr:class I SAM-dependent methyltransferase [Actinomycetes bacterium]
MATAQSVSASLEQSDYWWYRARADLLEAALQPYLGQPALVLDVGSADGPSIAWMRGRGQRIALDVNPQGLVAGTSVCASVLALPFADESFDVVGAFDVLEHCEPEKQAMTELTRVLSPGGRLLLSTPAYQWAWTDHDVWAGHYRRYTRRRLVSVVEATGLDILRSTYGFTSVFPFFVAERAMRRLRRRQPDIRPRLTHTPPAVEKVLMAGAGADRRLLRKHDLPFGSSIFIAAVKPDGAAQLVDAPQ